MVLQAIPAARVPVGFVHLPTAIGPLGLVHGHVGPLQEGVAVGGVLRCQGDADAGVDVEAGAVQLEGVLEGGRDAPCHQLGEGDVGSSEEHGELVAPQAADEVVGADGTGQAGTDLGQQLVAHVVADGVIDLLEPVEVDEQQGQGLARHPVGEYGGQALVEVTPVGQAGEIVGGGVPACVGQAPDLSNRPDGADGFPKRQCRRPYGQGCRTGQATGRSRRHCCCVGEDDSYLKSLDLVPMARSNDSVPR